MDMQQSDFVRLLFFEHARKQAEMNHAKNPLDPDNLRRWGGALLKLSQFQNPLESQKMIEVSVLARVLHLHKQLLNLLKKTSSLVKVTFYLVMNPLLLAVSSVSFFGKGISFWVCPDIRLLDGPLAIDAGRHPILESLHTDFIPNNVFLSEASNMVIVMGPNMSGKSTYLQQVCLVVILAQIGCYVPARFSSLRVADRIFTWMGTGDNLESNSSTFMTEMKETTFIMQNVSSR